MTSDGFTFFSVAQRPELTLRIERLIDDVWPTYFRKARSWPEDGRVDWSGIYRRWPHLQLGLLDGDRLIAAANSVPLTWSGPAAALPKEGWDWAMRCALDDHEAGHRTHTLCGLAVTIARDRQGEGLSRRMLRWMHAAGKARGMERLIVPVRPVHKARHPHTPMAEYATWVDAAGLPRDPWVRTHVRIGGRIGVPCDEAMRMTGTIQEWSAWLDTPLPDDGVITHPELLAPLQIADGSALYTEPNLWVMHGS